LRKSVWENRAEPGRVNTLFRKRGGRRDRRREPGAAAASAPPGSNFAPGRAFPLRRDAAFVQNRFPAAVPIAMFSVARRAAPG
jgi:hypothetical protein